MGTGAAPEGISVWCAGVDAQETRTGREVTSTGNVPAGVVGRVRLTSRGRWNGPDLSIFGLRRGAPRRSSVTGAVIGSSRSEKSYWASAVATVMPNTSPIVRQTSHTGIDTWS